MTSQRRKRNAETGEMEDFGPQFISRMASSDFIKLMAGLFVTCVACGFGVMAWVEMREEKLLEESTKQMTQAVEIAVAPIVVQLEGVSKRLDRLEAHEDAGWSVRGTKAGQ